MALRIRLARAGAKKRPYYRIVIADSRSPRDGRFLERVGSYNPLLKKDDPDRVKLNADRIRHWLSHGAVATDRVARFLGAAELAPVPAQRNNPQKALPKAKAQKRAKAVEEAAKAAEEAAKQAAAAPPPEPEPEPAPEPAPEEAPAEEPAAAEPEPAVAAAAEPEPAVAAAAEPEQPPAEAVPAEEPAASAPEEDPKEGS